MHKLVFFYPDGHENHQERGHPERPDRIERTRQALIEAGWWERYPHLPPLDISPGALAAVHTPDYLRMLETASAQGRHLDMDTYTTPASWELALQAAGGALAVADSVWRGEARRGFALCRPPGHHATPGRGMGFCLLNNIALAAEYLQRQHGTQKLAIVDLDLHHGNGTQEVFWRRSDVLYISTHQSPLYPGSGSLLETGAGAGAGATANFPLPPMSGDQAFEAVMQACILPLLDRFAPQMLLVSYGFDPHWRDPLGNLLLSGAGYARLVTALTHWADLHCGGRIILVLEGGYDLDAAAVCGQAVTAALLGEAWEDPLGPAPYAESLAWRGMLARAQSLWGLEASA